MACPRQAVTVWLREPGGTAFRAVEAPDAGRGPAPVALARTTLPARPDWHRFPLEHEGARLGLLEARRRPAALRSERPHDRGRPPGAVSRRGRAVGGPGRRGGGPVPRDRGAPAVHQPHHRQPAARPLRRRPRLSHPELEPEAGDRHPGTPARRRGRPAGLRRAHRGSRRRSCAPSSTGCSRPARSSRRSRRSTLGGEARFFRLSKIPMRLERRRDHPRDHHRRGRDRVAPGPGPDPAEREARGGRAARGRRHARDQQSARHHRRLRGRHRGSAASRHRGGGRRIPGDHRPGGGALQPHRGRPARVQPAQGHAQAAGLAQRAGGRDAVPAQAPPAVQAAHGGPPGSRRRCPRSWAAPNSSSRC